VLILFLIFTTSTSSAVGTNFHDVDSSVGKFSELSHRMQGLLKSEKALSILKLEYEIKSLPEFVVIRKLQSSILQTFYTAYDIAYISLCYSYIDYDDSDKMRGYYNLFMSTVDLFNDSSEKTITIINTNLSIKDGYLEKEYPNFAAILSELSNDIVTLRDFVNNFVKSNVPEDYFSDYFKNFNIISFFLFCAIILKFLK
jgi:hypothetical protein